MTGSASAASPGLADDFLNRSHGLLLKSFEDRRSADLQAAANDLFFSAE
jgi:hypothetical protein